MPDEWAITFLIHKSSSFSGMQNGDSSSSSSGDMYKSRKGFLCWLPYILFCLCNAFGGLVLAC